MFSLEKSFKTRISKQNKVLDKEADANIIILDLTKRRMAWASNQSSVLDNRDQLYKSIKIIKNILMKIMFQDQIIGRMEFKTYNYRILA